MIAMTIVQKQFFQRNVQLLSSQGQNNVHHVKINIKSLKGNCCVPLLLVLMMIDVIHQVMLIIVI